MLNNNRNMSKNIDKGSMQSFATKLKSLVVRDMKSKKLTLIGSDKYTETVELQFGYFASISKVFATLDKSTESGLTVTLPTTVDVCKRFLNNIIDCKEKLNIEDLYNYYKLAICFDMPSVSRACVIKVANGTNVDALKVYKHSDGESNQLTDIIVEKLMTNIKEVGMMCDKGVDLKLVKTLLSRKDYVYPVNNLGQRVNKCLECALVVLFNNWLTVNYPVVTVESRKIFIECWKLINVKALHIDLVENLLATTYGKDPEILGTISPDLLKSTISYYKYAVLDPERYVTHQQELDAKEQARVNAINDEKCMTLQEIEALKVGDLVDAKDRDGKWYVSKVVTIHQNDIKIHFNGWTDNFDERIPKTSKRFAKKGTFTHNIEHVDSEYRSRSCQCVACTGGRSRGRVTRTPSTRLINDTTARNMLDQLNQLGMGLVPNSAPQFYTSGRTGHVPPSREILNIDQLRQRYMPATNTITTPTGGLNTLSGWDTGDIIGQGFEQLASAFLNNGNPGDFFQVMPRAFSNPVAGSASPGIQSRMPSTQQNGGQNTAPSTQPTPPNGGQQP